MTMKICFVLLAAFLLTNASTSFAQSGGSFTITSQAVVGGGCSPNGSGGCQQSSGSGNLVLNASIGESGANDLSRQSPFTVRGGFWYGTLGATPTAANSNISGRIVDPNGRAIEGAAVRLSGAQNRLTVTDAQGNYHFDNVETNGLYTVTPSRANFSFSPSQRSFSQLGLHTDAAFNANNIGSRLNPLDTTEYFVRQQYVDFLNREPDEAGLNFWVDNIDGCGPDEHCREIKRIDTSAAFFLSIEFQRTGYLVYRIYRAAFGNIPNAPVPITLSEFTPDTQAIGKGVIVNQTGWQQQLEDNQQAYLKQFVERPRFASAYPTSITPAQFIDQLFANAAVSPAAVDRDAAIGEFGPATNTNDVAARARALRRVAEDSTLASNEFNRAFVLMQYFGYLRRNPNGALDDDYSGYNFWLTKLNQFNGNYLDAEMVKAFLMSIEYRQRFGAN
jgi:Carboxypeptidase regulatory-like domain/Domain of unknown function (DUF4214)